MRPNQSTIPLIAVVILFAGCGPAGDQRDTLDTPSTTTPDTLEGAAPTGKLPAGVRPLAYRLDLLLDPRQDGFSGEVAIDVNLDEPTSRIWLHGKGLAVSKVIASTESGDVVPGDYAEVLASGVSAISFEQELPAGIVSLELEYQGDFDRNLAGLFKVEEQGEPYVLAKSESIQARSFLPGFDEPGLKATFDISLTIPKDHEAIGNAPVIDRYAIDDGLQRLVFATTPPMPTYLLSLAVGPFDIVEREPIAPNDVRSRPIPLRGVARNGRGGDMNFVLDVTPRMIEIFERELQQPYPFEKLDIVAAPQWPSGATELSAAITYREQRILVGDHPAPGARLALWLKEGFATWATPLVLTLMEPDGGHDLNAAERSIRAMQLDSLASTRAIREPISDNNEIRNAYDAITYAKSLGVIHMVDQYFGSDTFRPALGRYVDLFSGGVADSAAFYEVIGEETKTPALTETFRGFVEQSGVPLLDATLNCEPDDAPLLTLRQSRYKALGSPIEDTGKLWNIPVCVRSDNASQCVIMTEARQTLTLSDSDCPRWVLPNAGGSGYYRWSLDEAAWAALIEDFESLTPVEALSAIDSAFAAFEAGKLNQDNLLNIVAASSRAQARQVVTAPLPYLQKYVRQYFSTSEKSRFLALARGFYQPIIDRSVNSTDGDAQLLYADLISFQALTLQDTDARKRLLHLAHSFTGFERDRDSNALRSDLYYPALAVAIEDSDDAFLHHLVEFRSSIDDPLFESASANAFGHSNDPRQIGFIHELVLGEQLGPREKFGMISVALSESVLRDQHWNWLRENFPTYVGKVPAQWRRHMPSMGANFCNDSKRAELGDLFAEYGSLVAGYHRSLSQVEENIGLCIALTDQARKLARAVSAM
jgi:alanyl aminopeptidase